MTASTYIGRVGGLAVALGVGAAILGGSGTAWAGPDTSAKPGPSASDPGTGGASDVGSAIKKAVKDTLSNVASIGARARELGNAGTLRTNLHALADNVGPHLTTTTPTLPRQRTSGTETLGKKPPLTAPSLPILGTTKPRLNRAVETLSSHTTAPSLPETLSSIATPLKATSNAGAQTNGVAAVVANMVTQVLRPLGGNTPATPPVDPPTGLTDLVQLAGLRRGLSGASAVLDQPSSSAASPTLVLNGYNIVPSPRGEEVASFYGLFNIVPATPGSVQGNQEFQVVDPNSRETVGTFNALVNNTNSFLLGGTFQELVVTDGTVNAATPPPGTLIATNRFGMFGLFGTLYTSTPSASGNVVSFKFLTPLGDIPIPLDYDAGKVLTDVSKPVDLGNGYYIAPDPVSREVGTGITGVAPYFAVYQGAQVFNVYQEGNPEPVGKFKGYVATTADLGSNTTQAILVTEVLDEGTEPGVVPTVGSVYNVIYGFGLAGLYSAIPSSSGGPTKINFNIKTPLGLIAVPLNWDATATPTVASLPVPDKYTLVPVADLQPIGINGLPPREVQIQGYQQFDVHDSAGVKIGTVDADVTTQYSFTGNMTESVLVTKVTAPEGTDPASLPPVGSQFSYAYLPGGGVGVLYSAMPSPSGDITTVTLLTPLGNVGVPFPFYDAVKGLEDVTYAHRLDV